MRIMEVQVKALQTFLIVSVIYTLTIGAPVKRQAHDMVENAKSVLINIKDTLCPNTTQLSCNLGLSKIDMADVDDYLKPVLELQKAALKQAVNKCISSTDLDPHNCELATAAIRLQTTIVDFVAISVEAWNIMINCTPPKDADMEQTLCRASLYTKKVLDLAG